MIFCWLATKSIIILNQSGLTLQMFKEGCNVFIKCVYKRIMMSTRQCRHIFVLYANIFQEKQNHSNHGIKCINHYDKLSVHL